MAGFFTQFDSDRIVRAIGDAESRTSAEIRVGDLLTTSVVRGHAMAVPNDRPATGAVLGKALTGLEEGLGMVDMLISLQ